MPWLEEVLMGLGAALWLSGELLAKFTSGDTTTRYVRMKWIGRAGATAFAVWQVLHFSTGIV